MGINYQDLFIVSLLQYKRLFILELTLSSHCHSLPLFVTKACKSYLYFSSSSFLSSSLSRLRSSRSLALSFASNSKHLFSSINLSF